MSNFEPFATWTWEERYEFRWDVLQTTIEYDSTMLEDWDG